LCVTSSQRIGVKGKTVFLINVKEENTLMFFEGDLDFIKMFSLCVVLPHKLCNLFGYFFLFCNRDRVGLGVD
jgi:hypothetical protein